MNISTKLLKAAASQAVGAGLDVDEVFSTFLYTGTASNKTITNGIDLSGEGGLTWIKSRSHSTAHALFDTARGAGNYLNSANTNAQNQGSYTDTLTGFTSTGFTLGSDADTWWVNGNNYDYVSWTFRKAPKFFQCLTYSGTGSAQNISHNLGSVPGMIIIKQTNTSRDWIVYHRSLGTAKHISLNQTLAAGPDNSGEYWGGTTPTSTQFSLGDYFAVNQNGGTYVAYLFAHNDSGDGGFGPDGDQDIIKCGSFTKGDTGVTNFINVDLGFEVQWLLTKSTASENWDIWDVQRGMNLTQAKPIRPNLSNTEGNFASRYIHPTPTGFAYQDNNDSTYIYMAIRRGPLAAPTDATKVFGIDKYEDGSGDGPTNGIVNDFSLLKAVSGSGNWFATSRLQGANRMKVDNNSAEASNSNAVHDRMDGVWNTNLNNHILWGWKRAPSYFDVVAYSGTGSARTVPHGLQKVPEMIWLKKRNGVQQWVVYHSAIGSSKYMHLDNTDGANSGTFVWNGTDPTSTHFSVTDIDAVNDSSGTYIAYLFATVAGVSKVGSYTGNGSSQNIDCGFSSGARFVLIKRTNSGGDWWIFDTARGIVSGNDPYLKLNTSDAEYTESDEIDPLSSGFTVNETGNTTLNTNTHSYIFYAIA